MLKKSRLLDGMSIRIILLVFMYGLFLEFKCPLSKTDLDYGREQHTYLLIVGKDCASDDDKVTLTKTILTERLKSVGVNYIKFSLLKKDKTYLKVSVYVPNEKHILNTVKLLLTKKGEVKVRVNHNKKKKSLAKAHEKHHKEAFVILKNKDFKSARLTEDYFLQINITLTEDGKNKFSDYTANNKGKKLDITVDGDVIASPIIREHITDGRVTITGIREKDIALVLTAGINAKQPLPCSLSLAK